MPSPPAKQRSGIDLHISEPRRIAPESVDPRVKNHHRIDLVQSMFDAYDRGHDTSCVVDAAGHVTEGPGFNVFMVEGGVVHSADSGVPGSGGLSVAALLRPARSSSLRA